MSAEKELTDATFDEAIQSGVALVDFWAPWCGPCKMQGPIIEEVAKEFDGKAVVGKLEVDENPKAAAKYGVQSIPTLVVFKDGKEVERFVGVQDKDSLAATLNNHIG